MNDSPKTVKTTEKFKCSGLNFTKTVHIVIIEKILEKVIPEMTSHLEPRQQEHLKNVLYVNFHGLEVQKECTELAATGQDGDEVKIKMFIASKKAINRQDNTLRNYANEIITC